MRIEDFKSRYEGIPFTTSTRDYKKNTVKLNFEQLSHMHKEMELLLVLEGKAKLYVENTPFNITKGDIVIMPPFTLHRYTILSDYDFKHYCMCFDSDILYDKTFASAIEDGSITVKNIIQQNEKCAELIKEAFRVFKEKKPGWELQVVGNMSLIFGVFIELGYFEKHRVDAEKYIFPKIFGYINNNFNSNIKSSDIADYLHISRSYFCRLFRKCFGDSFQNYLCKYRIEKSKALLKNTNMSISEIAVEVGFNNFSYYSKKFKEYISQTPSEYRDRNQK